MGSFVWVDDAPEFRKRVADVARTATFADGVQLTPLLAEGKDELRALISDIESSKREPPQFIIVDLDLEDESYTGIEALQDVRACPNLALCPVIIHSLHVAGDSVQRSYTLHANSVVEKPGRIGEQKKMIEDILRYWSSLNLKAAS